MAITLTEKAAQAIRGVLAQEDLPQGFLRVGVRGGGCAGTSYTLHVVQQPAQDDEQFESRGVRIVADPTSLVLVDGSEIVFSGGLEGEFVFHTPNARRRCHCGGSFST